MRDNIFTVFARDHNRLSYLLRNDANGLADSAARALNAQDLTAFVGDAMAETIASVRRLPPVLGPLLPARSGEGNWREIEPGHRIPTTRLFYDIQVVGDDEVLTYWPDENDDHLRPVDQALIDDLGGDLGAASDEDSRRFYASDCRWIADGVTTPTGESITRLTTWTDLTEAELADPAERERVSALFRQRRVELEAILSATSAQMSKFYDIDLPEQLRQRAAARQTSLDNLNAAFTTIGIPTEWKLPPPAAVEVHDPPVASIEGLPVTVRARLEPVSYADIQRTIRLWADKVEEYPDAFTSLIEDRMSDLLSATLHAATPGAGREIYSRGGKTDIHIRADILAEGLGPASIFVLEAKWVEGREDIFSAIEDQLMRYTPVAATSTVLLAMSRNSRVANAVANIRSWAREVPGFVGEAPGEVDGWPIFTYRIAALGDLEMQVCVATVAVPAVPRTRAQGAATRAAEHAEKQEGEGPN